MMGTTIFNSISLFVSGWPVVMPIVKYAYIIIKIYDHFDDIVF
jgi:hypothetical protein